MVSKTQIANMALSHLGVGKEIANIETEQSEEASACRRFYEIAKEVTLADLDWTFATEFFTLNLIETTPSNEWGYSYRYPVDCLALRRILSGNRNDTQQSRIPFKVLTDGTGKIIYTDQPSAEVEYTRNVSDSSYFTPEFSLALSFRLASYIAARVTAGDPFKLKNEMLAQYALELGSAKKQNMNEENRDRTPDSELITIRY